MIQIARIAWNLQRANLGAHRGHNFAQRRFADLQRDPRTDVRIMSRWIPACVSCRDGYRQPCKFKLTAEVRSRNSWPSPSCPVISSGTGRSMRVLRRPSGPVNPKSVSAVGIMLTRGLRANGEIKSKRGIVHLAHWNAHGREWADLLAQQNDQSSYDRWILTEVTSLLPNIRQRSRKVYEFHSSRTAKTCAPRVIAQSNQSWELYCKSKNQQKEGVLQSGSRRNTPPSRSNRADCVESAASELGRAPWSQFRPAALRRFAA